LGINELNKNRDMRQIRLNTYDWAVVDALKIALTPSTVLL
jgi:hypothetical protein